MLFSDQYSQARGKFRASAAEYQLESLPVPGLGPDGEALTIDIAYRFPKGAKRCLLSISGVHGVEGFIGSAVQCQALSQVESSHAVCFIHAVNPYGMAWFRRVNENNVDLNRNYRGGDFQVPDSKNYKVWSPYLNPRTRWQIFFGYLLGLYAFLRVGHSGSMQAICQGQYHDDGGIFFGGYEQQHELDLVGSWVREKLSPFEEIWALDIHSGLGPYNEESLIIDLAEPEENRETYKQIYSKEMLVPYTGDGWYRSYGEFSEMLRDVLGPDRLFYLMQEFGTFNEFYVGNKMRIENAHHLHLGADISHKRKRDFLQCFCPQDPFWRESCLDRGLTRIQQLSQYLSARG